MGYLLAKVCERYDRQIFEFTGAISRLVRTVDWLIALDLARLEQSPAAARILGA